jgi:uncharacterized membrane protein HdeD (DUF308 family)
VNKENHWWYGFVQGAVPLGIGLYLLISPTGASITLGIAAAIYLVVVGLVHTIRGLRLRSDGVGNIIWIRGLIGLIIGAILLVMGLFNIGTLASGYTILAIGLIAFGAVGLFTDAFQRGEREFAWGPILVDLALLAWGVLVFYSRSRQFDLANASGWVLAAVGAILLVWTFLHRPKSDESAATA